MTMTQAVHGRMAALGFQSTSVSGRTDFRRNASLRFARDEQPNELHPPNSQYKGGSTRQTSAGILGALGLVALTLLTVPGWNAYTQVERALQQIDPHKCSERNLLLSDAAGNKPFDPLYQGFIQGLKTAEEGLQKYFGCNQ